MVHLPRSSQYHRQGHDANDYATDAAPHGNPSAVDDAAAVQGSVHGHASVQSEVAVELLPIEGRNEVEDGVGAFLGVEGRRAAIRRSRALRSGL